ncbi:MAG: ABC-2 transporter permease [Ruminococcus sp.]|nr:ABC-2 transporter permease [Ruminococcus sp.]
MKNLIFKEFKLALHPTSIIFLTFAAMLFIPSYPYYTAFFYTTLALFFTCLTGRENHDIYYTCLLPVSKGDAVRSRILYAVIFQLAQVLLCVPVILVKLNLNIPENTVGMEANAALLGLSLIMLGIFNFTFFTAFYKNVLLIGKPFLISGAVTFAYIFIAESLCHALPFFRDVLDNTDRAFLPQRLLVLAAGVIIYAVLTLAACKKSVKLFEEQDL